MDDPRALQHARQHFGRLDTHRADEHGLTPLVRLLDFLHHRGELVAPGLEDGVVAIYADARLVRRDHLHRQTVDVVELRRFRLRRARHAGELLVHAEIILDRDRRIRARLALDAHVFLGFDGLVQAVRPAATRHDAAGVFVNDQDLAVGRDDVFDVALIEGVGPQELRDGVTFFRDIGVALLGNQLALLALLGGHRRGLVEIAELGREIRQHERIRIVGPQAGAANLREVGLMLALVDDEQQLLLEPVNLLFVQVGVQLRLHLVEPLAPLPVLQQPQELLVLRVAHLDLEHLAGGEHLVVVAGARFFEQLLRLSDDFIAEPNLVVDQLLDGRLEAGERLLPLDRRGTGNDQRRARFVDEDGVDFVDDAEPIIPLHLIFLPRGHAVVAQVVEAELARGAVGDIAAVHLAALVRRHLLLDAAHGDAEERVQMPHPLGVAAGQVVVDGDKLGVPAGEGVEVKRESRDEGLAFARGHFRDPALVNRNAADELHVEVHHVPRELVVADDDLAAHHAAGGVLHRGKRFGENLLEGRALVGGRRDSFPKLRGLGPQLVVGQRLVGLLQLVDARDRRPRLLEELLIVPAGKPFEQKREHEGGRTLGALRGLANGKSNGAYPPGPPAAH